MRARLAEATARWRNNQAAWRLDRERDPDGTIYSGIHAGYSRLIGVANQRWAFVSSLPWKLWEGRDQAMAQSLLADFRAAEAAGKVQQRVSNWWCIGDLSRDFIAHCDGDGISPRLELELSALEAAKFDGSSVEAIHGQLGRIATTSTAAAFRTKSAGVRLKQNLTEYDLYCSLNMASKFHKCFDNFKSVLQRRRRGMRNVTAKRISDSAFSDHLYRYGVQSHADWSALGGFMVPRESHPRLQASTTSQKIKKDFIMTMVRPNVLYSVVHDRLAVMDGALEDEARAAAVDPHGAKFVVFEILDTNPNSRKIHVPADTSDMYCPCLVQSWDVSAFSAMPDDPTELSLRPSATAPVVMDVGALAPFQFVEAYVDQMAEP